MSEEIGILDEHKYFPLTNEEFETLKNLILNIGARLPEDKAPYVWDMFVRLNGVQEPRPCMCASAGGHWKKAVDFLHKWVNEKL